MYLVPYGSTEINPTLGTAAWKTKSAKFCEVELLAEIAMLVTVVEGSWSNVKVIFNPALSKATTPSTGSKCKIASKQAPQLSAAVP